jgi:hypothetical protein
VPAGANADLVKAREFYREGLRHFEQTRPGHANVQMHLREAARRFRTAQQLLENAARQEPGSQEIGNLQVENNRFLYTCLKMQTL